MNNTKMRRFTAYCLDLLIITLIATGLFQIKFLHPKAQEYEDAYKEYNDYVKKINEANIKGKKDATLIVYYSDELTDDEVKELDKNLNKLDDVKDTQKITKDDIEDNDDTIVKTIGEYFNENEGLNAFIVTVDGEVKIDNIIKKVEKIENISDTIEYEDEETEEIKSIADMSDKEKKEYLAKMGTLLHNVDYYGISYNVCWLVVVILYFTLFPYFNKGMTIGKRIVKLQMVRSDKKDKKVALWQYFIKAILCPIYGTGALSNVLTFLVMVITPLFLNGINFAYTTTYVNLAICIFCYIEFFTIAFRKDGLGISDKLARVEVRDYVRD